MQTVSQLKKGELKGAVSVKISENLTEFPVELFELADTLEYLDLSSNKLSNLPDDFYRFKSLRIFFASDNLFTTYPEVLGRCDALDIVGFKSNNIKVIPASALNLNLRWLILTGNKIEALPPSIGNCKRMQKLMLAGNQLASLPETLANCSNLSLLRIAANRITELPEWLLGLPNLAWLAFSGNHIKQDFTFADAQELNFEQFNLKELLGEGASGTIYKAERSNGEAITNVAIKIFKGNVTSDGYPDDEMNAYIAAGSHPVLVGLLGKVNFSKEKKRGLVMNLIPEDFFNLGAPPSLESCTRDIFNTGIGLSKLQVLKVANSMASVAQQLHARGIIHGDLYAHNILINENGDTLFGDFGAASFYNKNNAVVSFYLEKIEVKAYGYLLDDLLSICVEEENPSLVELARLRDLCLLPQHAERPGFDEIVEKLTALSD
ncbi:protein kinase [Pedobacter sp. G11]|nr:protein kinase [Pedobacter sp. G11]